MPALDHVRVALLEARLSGELATLVRRHGGDPVSVPALRETRREAPGAGRFLERLCAGGFAYVVFLTGVGAAALLREADRRGRLADTLAALGRTVTACRGPKPSAVLHRHAVPIGRTAADPYTTTELLAALEQDDLRDVPVGVVHYGEPNLALTRALEARGARLAEIQLYQWELPDDTGPLTNLVRELLEGRVDALVVTSQVQCRHLFAIADRVGLTGPLAEALNGRVVVASIGPVSTRALRDYGVTPRVMPATPKMGPLITALADYYDLTRS
jgi:uroporphyrinogen-III synthase